MWQQGRHGVDSSGEGQIFRMAGLGNAEATWTGGLHLFYFITTSWHLALPQDLLTECRNPFSHSCVIADGVQKREPAQCVCKNQ